MALAKVIVGTTLRITGTLKDDNGDAIEPDTLVYSLYAVQGEDDKTLIGAADQALTPASDAAGGALDVRLTPAQNVMANGDNESEIHRIRYKYTYDSGNCGIDYYTFVLITDEAPTS